MAAIEPADFANECLLMWRVHPGGNAHYVAAVAMLRSKMSDDTVGGKVGPYGWTQDQWNSNLDLKNPALGADTFGPGDINDWTAQVSVYTLNTVNALQGLNSPSALQLYQKQWSDAAADPQLATNFQQACDDTKQVILDAIDRQLPDSTATASVIADPTKPLAAGASAGGAGAGQQGIVTGPQGIPGNGGVLGALVAAHESGGAGYNAYNRGNAGDSAGATMNFATMSLAQITQLQALPSGNPNRLFAVGKYQLIPSTMKDAIIKLKLTLDTMLTPSLQEALFRNYLVAIKRPQVKSFVTGQGAALADAQLALAREFASFPDPSTGLSVYGGSGGNQATVTVAQSASALTTEQASYNAKVAGGIPADQAWVALSA